MEIVGDNGDRLALAGPTWAQTGAQDMTARAGSSVIGQVEQGAWSSHALLGQEVLTARGETLGQIEGFVFTPNDRIAGVIVDAGAYLGTERRPVVVDWQALNVRPADQRIFIDPTRVQTAAAPEQDEGILGGWLDGWRQEQRAELPDIIESQPGVIAGDPMEEAVDSPSAGVGSTGGPRNKATDPGGPTGPTGSERAAGTTAN